LDLKTIAHLGRFKDIAVVLIKYGFEELVAEFDLPGKGLIQKIHRVDVETTFYERIRLALEDLGPTFVKFGQVMSLRPDLVPVSLAQELKKLQDEGKPVEFLAVREVMAKKLDKPLDQVFSFIEEKPVAAASLSQVHRAILLDGRTVVAAKVQRPEIRPLIKTDLDILAAIAEHLHTRSPEAAVYDLPNLVRVIRKTLLHELDFRREARHIRVARSYLKGESQVHIPRVYEEYCTEDLLVMEFIQGKRLKDWDVRDQDQGEYLAKLGLKTMIEQILNYGFFHADPHPGNVLIQEGPVFCLLDWGMVGRLTPSARQELIDLIVAVVDKDSEKLTQTLLTISMGEHQLNRGGLERDLLELLDAYHAIPIKDLHLGQLLLEITTLMREHHLRLPPELAVMVKAMVSAEGTALLLYPGLDIVSEAEPHVRRLAKKRFGPKTLWRNLRNTLGQILIAQRKVPEQLGQIVNKIVRGELSIRFEHENLGGLQRTLENTFNRLTLGVIIAAMIIGSSMIITTGVKPLLFGLPALGVVGYLISGVLGLWLVFSIIRTRRF
jgi:ubiquinone biosynthesis protein